MRELLSVAVAALPDDNDDVQRVQQLLYDRAIAQRALIKSGEAEIVDPCTSHFYEAFALPLQGDGVQVNHTKAVPEPVFGITNLNDYSLRATVSDSDHTSREFIVDVCETKGSIAGTVIRYP